MTAPSWPHADAVQLVPEGGIRAAAFSCGVLETLATRGFLKSVDYMATVSGGGYTGTSYISHLRSSRLRRGASEDVDAWLLRVVQHLREHMTARAGYLFDAQA